MLTQTTQKRSAIDTYQWFIRSVIYVLVVVSAARGLIIYFESWQSIVLIFVPFSLVLMLEKVVAEQKPLLRWVYVVVQLLMVAALFYIARYADFWSLLLFPVCYMAPRLFESRSSFIVLGLTVSTMTLCLWVAEGGYSSLLFSPIYLVSYVMIFAFSKIILQLDDSLSAAKTLGSQLENSNQRLRQLAEQSAQLASDETRHKVARDLHDSVTQTLFSVNLMLGSLLAKPNFNAQEARNELGKIQGLSESAMKELRGIISHLRPANPPQIPFTAQLHQVLDDIHQQSPLEVAITYDGVAIPQLAVPSLVRIVREALMNIVKHAHTQEAAITLVKSGRNLSIEITDQGIGFDLSSAKKTGHMGLEAMQQHSLEIGAQLNIYASPEQGCRISLLLPLTHEAMKTE